MRPLIHIGYHKTGTTWLQKRVFPDARAGFSFVGDPDAVRSALVAINPFDFDPGAVRERFGPGIEEAEGGGLVPVLSHERLSGSPYAGGHDSRITADPLAEAFPGARILVSIREQKSVILSIYKQYLRWGGAASIEQFLTAPPGMGRIPIFRFDFYAYHRLIRHYQSLFGAENVLVLPYEMLKASPEGYLGRISGFLGTPLFVPGPDRDNVSPSALALAIKRHANRFVVRDALNPAPLFERQNANKPLHKMARRIDELTTPRFRQKHEDRWRRYVEARVGARYDNSNAAVGRLTGLDLGSFGYPVA